MNPTLASFLTLYVGLSKAKLFSSLIQKYLAKADLEPAGELLNSTGAVLVLNWTTCKSFPVYIYVWNIAIRKMKDQMHLPTFHIDWMKLSGLASLNQMLLLMCWEGTNAISCYCMHQIIWNIKCDRWNGLANKIQTFFTKGKSLTLACFFVWVNRD